MTSQGAGEGGWNLGRRSLARRIRLTTAAIVMVAILGTAGIGTVVAAEIPGTTAAPVATSKTGTGSTAPTTTSQSATTTSGATSTATSNSNSNSMATTKAPTTTSRPADTTSGATG
ncbi:MAG TPA: hypothetical protein VIJ09_08460 [Acidimicrobiales bacterium]